MKESYTPEEAKKFEDQVLKDMEGKPVEWRSHRLRIHA